MNGKWRGLSGKSTTRRVAGLVAVLAVSIFASAPGADAAQLVEFGQFCAESGEEGGQCKNGEGVAVNRTGAGGVAPGDVYVVENSNRRVQEFTPHGGEATFVRAWGKDVIKSGEPNDTGTGFEICEVEVECKAGGSSAEAGALVAARGIAIDQETGDVYVADSTNRRVDVFSAEGQFEGAFGWKVQVTGAAEELQFCTEATGCQAGASTTALKEKAGGFNNLATGAMAVDPSSGNLWVGDATNRRINEFEPELTGGEVTGVSFVRALGWNVDAEAPAEELQECTTATGCKAAAAAGPGDGRFNEPRGLAVDSAGDVYAASAGTSCTVAVPCRVFKFNPDGTFKEVFGPSSGGNAGCQLTWNTDFGNDHGTFGMAVDPTDQHLFLARKTEKTAFEICEFDSNGTLLQRSPNTPIPTNLGGGNHQTLALGNEGRVFAQAPTEANDASPVHILGLVPAPGAEVLAPTELTPTSATLNGVVTTPSPGGTGFDVAYRFEYSGDYGLTWKTAPIFGNASLGTTAAGPHAVEQKIAGLLPNTTYKLRLVATTSFTTTVESTFTTPVGLPGVEEQPVNVTQTAATLQARIDPAGATTTYHFEWGSGSGGSYGHRIPTDHELFAGSGNEAVRVTADISGLSPVAQYHFRVVATNSKGSTTGPGQPFETLNAAGLPDNRGYELVSPADKGSAGVVGGFELYPQEIAASQDGDSMIYPIENGIPGSTAGGFTRWQANRTDSGWQNEQVSAPSLIPAPGSGQAQYPSLVLYTPPDFGCAIVQTYNPLTADTPPLDVEEGVSNLYRRNADGSWDLISNWVPLNPGFTGPLLQRYFQIETSEDCSRVFFETPYELIAGASGLYEWDEGTLRDAGVRPDGSVGAKMIGGIGTEPRAVAGGELNVTGTAHWNAVTPGGALFFTAISDEGPDAGTPAVFMRSPGGDSIVDLSQSHTSVPTAGARFEAASPDGGTVLFRANYGIAEGASSAGSTGGHCGPTESETQFGSHLGIEAKPCDLYAYDVEREELTDLSADTADSEGAQIQGAVAVSEDGSHAYFAALGQLVPEKGRSYAQNVAGEGSANVYLADAGHLSYVTTLSVDNGTTGDLFGGSGRGGGAIMRVPAHWTAGTSADGERLLFESASNPTAYDSGGYKEAYLYSAASGRVVCVSCRPDGLPREAHAGAEERLLARPRVVELSDRARSISADGSRVFFSSPAVLAPGAIEGVVTIVEGVTFFTRNNVYEWHDGQISWLATVEPSASTGLGEYLDASASGNDVFFATGTKLSPRDTDGVADVYDVRVGGGDVAEATPTPCDPADSGCQGPPSAQPSASAPASAGFAGPGNPTEPGSARPCGRFGHRAAALSRRAKHLMRNARKVNRRNHRRAVRLSRKAHRLAKQARGLSKHAKRCRRTSRRAGR